MKFNFKKISSIAASVAMIGSSIAFAAAAYPQPYVTTTGVGDVAIVYGNTATDDFAAATSIGTSLGASLSTDVSAPTGESILFEKDSTKFQIGYGLKSNVVSTAIDDDSPQDGLPTLLADGKYVDDDNDEFDYTQKITMADLNLTMWESGDYIADEPTLGFKIDNGAHVLNYTLEFVDQPVWGDLDQTDITLLGKKYFILSHTENTTLNLLDSATTTTLAEGESTTLNIGGTSYAVNLDFVGSSTAKFTINDKQTNALSAGDTQKIAGIYVGVKSIDSQDYAGGVKNVEFALGSGKLKLEHKQDVEMNDNAIDDLKTYITNSSSTSGTKITKIVIEWDADDDLFVTETQELVMPGFEAVKLSYTGMVYPAEEHIKVSKYNDKVIMLDDFPLKTSTEDIYLLHYANTTLFNVSSFGKDEDEFIATSNDSRLLFNKSLHAYFVASFNDGTTAESYLMRATSFITESSVNKTTFEYRKDGVWTEAKSKAKNGDTVNPGGSVEFTVDRVEKDYETVNFTGASNVEFNTVYSKEGLQVYLPWTNLSSDDSTNVAMEVAIWNETAGFLNGTNNNGDGYYDTWTLVAIEEDKNENIGSGDSINMTIGFNSASTPEISVEGIRVALTGIRNTHGATFVEKGSSDVYRSFVYSALGTEILWSKPSSGQKTVELIYHGGEAYGRLYLTASGKSTTASGAIVPIKDTESGSVTTNMIVVGGSCINTVAAKLLGSEVPLCGSDWTTKTARGADEWIIKSYSQPNGSAGKIAVLVAGWEMADTKAAATYFTTTKPDMSTVGGKVDGPVA